MYTQIQPTWLLIQKEVGRVVNICLITSGREATVSLVRVYRDFPCASIERRDYLLCDKSKTKS